MSLEQVEVELGVALTRLQALRNELAKLERWANDLQTSANVLRRLAGLPELIVPDETGDHSPTPSQQTGHTRSRDPRPKVKGTGERIGEVAVSILKAEGRRMKTAELAEIIMKQGFILGGGNPGRVTSDLSNALGRYTDAIPNRRLGWGLQEWGDPLDPTSDTEDETNELDLKPDLETEG